MIKLFCQIIENIDNDYDDLSECMKFIEKENIIIENPFIYLFNKILNKMNNNEQKIIKIYYNKILLICLNKILEIEKKEDIIKDLIMENINNIILLLLSDNTSYISENKFIINSLYSNTFEEEALFYSKIKKQNIKGVIICFLKGKFDIKNISNYDNEIDNKKCLLFESYFKNSLINYFDETLYLYNERNIKNNFSYALVLMNEDLESDIYYISKVKAINTNNIILDENCSNYKELFIKKNSKLIFDIIIEEIKKDNINEIMIYAILKMIEKLFNYLNKEDFLIIFKFLWNLYNKKIIEENNYIFLSLEYLENILDKYFDINIVNIIGGNYEPLSDSYKYTIKENALSIKLMSEGLDYLYENDLINPIEDDDLNNNIKNIYSTQYKLNNLSFYKCKKISTDKIINNNSILFTESIIDLNQLLNLSKIIEESNKMIKVIIVKEITLENKKIIDFVNKNKIPLYKSEKIFKIFIDFFIEGKLNHIYLSQKMKDKKNNNNFNEVYSFDFNINDINENILNKEYFKSEINKKDEENKIQIIEDYNGMTKKIYNELISESKKIFNLLNIKLIKRLIYQIFYLEPIKLSDLKIIFQDIKNFANIYEVLCMEYYFNIQLKYLMKY